MVAKAQDGREELRWVLLSHRLPREPSTPRIAVWRKLRRLGVAQLSDGLVALPLSAKNREQLEWIADEVIENGGSATIWLARPASSLDEEAIARALSDAVGMEYAALLEEARRALASDVRTRRRTVARLRREMRRIGQRDHFSPPEGEAAREAVEALATSCEVRG